MGTVKRDNLVARGGAADGCGDYASNETARVLDICLYDSRCLEQLFFTEEE
jgi:hypothetical protein